MKRKQVFYGWYVVIACFLIMATAMGIVYNCASLFIKPISDDLGFSRQSVNMITSITSVGTMLASVFAGKIFTKNNIIAVMRVCAVLMCGAFFCYSFVSSLIGFYSITAVVSVCQATVTVIPISFLINNWFYEKRGYAMGLASMGSGVGGMIFTSLTGKLILSFGWRSTYQILAAIVLVTLLPCVFFILKLQPSQMGLTPYGVSEDTPVPQESGLDMTQVKKTATFWSMGACTILLGLCMNIMFGSIAPHLGELGYSLTFSANLLGVSMGALAVGKLFLGKLFDKLGVKTTFTLACGSLMLGTWGLYFAKFSPMLALVVLGVALGCSFGAVCYPIAVPSVFGTKSYRSIIGIYSATLSLGGIIGPLITGYVFDTFGSYNYAFIGAGVIMFFVTVAQQLIFSKKLV